MPLPDLDNGDFRTPSQTDSSRERGRVEREPTDLGRSESLDPDEAGDIADETPGHRG